MSYPFEKNEPILPGTAATDYERYLRTDELLALQKKPEQMNHPDELTFQVVHQSSELMMKAACWDFERAREHTSKGEFPDAARLMRRANEWLNHTIAFLHMLETLTPYDYHKIRAGLGHGSGLDSPGFLALLSLAPKLGEPFFAQVKQAGITLEQMYREHHKYAGLHDVAEQLIDFDEKMQIFRFHHLKLAQRIIGGSVVGTGGLPMELLRQRQETFFYKALWEVRNDITARANAAMGEKATGHGETSNS
jgi:tryptophan 2,3-dioxygenase